MAKNRSERVRGTEEKGGKSPEGKMCSPKAVEREVGVGLRGAGAGGEMEGSISNFSAEFTVDSFPIRLG